MNSTNPSAPFETLNIADGIEHLNTLGPEAAAAVLTALPRQRAIDMLDRPELQQAARIVQLLADADAAALLDGIGDDRAADIFLELDEATRLRLSGHLNAATRAAIQVLMHYPVRTAGSLMTTEFVSVPANWTIGETLAHVRRVERSRETLSMRSTCSTRTATRCCAWSP